MNEKQPSADSRQRIDKWLFFARMAKSRSLAQDYVASGLITVNDRTITQASHQLKPGDRVTIEWERRTIMLVVRAAGSRRGPYEEAKLLYDDITPPEDAEAKLTAFEQAQRQPGAGRPTKKERRAIERLRPDDDL